MSDHEWEGIGLYQAIINIIAASTSAALGVLKLTGGTMSGAIAMGSQLITGLAQATAAGHALRYEALGPGTLPTAGTAFTATNVTRVGGASDDDGRVLHYTSQTATPRLSGEYVAGTRIVGRIQGGILGVAGALPAAGGACLVIRRSSDGKYGSFGFNVSGAGVTPVSWTDKDNYLAVKTSSVGTHMRDAWLRFGSDGAGNIVGDISADGVTGWTELFTATETSFWGSVGAPDGVGRGVFTQSTIGFYTNRSRRETVT